MFLDAANRSELLAIRNAQKMINERVEKAGGHPFCQCHEDNDMFDLELTELGLCARCELPPSE